MPTQRLAALFALPLVLAATPGPGGAAPPSGSTGVSFDFEQRYFMEPGMIAADHAIVFSGNEYHLFYTVGFQGQGWGQPGNMIDFGHASSVDLIHWTIHPHVLSTEAPGWKERNLWAPHLMTGFSGETLMFFTGVDSSVVQQIGIATSQNLFDWTEPPYNPIYHPDPSWANWQLGQWSNGRDPFVTTVPATQQYAMLTTASTKPGYLGIPESRGAIGLAFATNLAHCTDLGAPLFINDSYRVLESTYLVQRNGSNFLFYNESGIPGVHFMKSALPFAGWSKSSARLFEYEGFAAEVVLAGNRWLYARVRDGIWNELPILGIKIDDLIWQGSAPTIGPQNTLFSDWTIVEGNAFALQPTFGDRPGERTGENSNIQGSFWISTAEQHAGPIAWGCPECPPDESLTGTLRSRVFKISGNYIALRVGGGDDSNLYVRLRRASDGAELFRATGLDSDVMREVAWDVRPHRRKDAYLEIVDHTTGVFGHINVDWIRESANPPQGAVVEGPGQAGTALRVASPPQGVGTFGVRCLSSPGPAPLLRITLANEAPIALAIYDAAGRQVRRLDLGQRQSGVHEAAWDGRAESGEHAGAGVYFYRLLAPNADARGRLVLTR